MSYVDNSLVPGEKVLKTANFHWIMFLKSSLFFAFGMFMLLASGAEQNQDDQAGMAGMALMIIVVASIYLFAKFLEYKTSEFALTNKRIVAKVGLIRRTSLELRVSKVESVSVNQGVIGRILNFGDVIVTGTGGAVSVVPRISNPLAFRNEISNSMIELEQSPEKASA